MKTFSLKPSLVVHYKDRPMRFMGKSINNKLMFKDEYGETINFSTAQFYEFFEDRQIIIDTKQPHLGATTYVRNVAPDLECHPKKHAEEALRRKRYVDAVRSPNGKLPNRKELNKQLPLLAKQFGDEHGAPSATTVRRWLNRP